MRWIAGLLVLGAGSAMAQDMSDVPDAPRGGDAQSAIEARVAEFNPCSPLGTEVGGFSLGVDDVEDVAIRHVNLQIDGDGIIFRIEGRLVCEDGANPQGASLAADVLADLEGILSRCEITHSQVDLTNTEGEMSWALDLASPLVEGLLTARIEEEARRLCNALAA